MRVVCTSCKSRLSFNPKADRRLRDLVCPNCGGHYRRAPFDPGGPDPLVQARILTARMESAAERVETALAGVRDLGPSLAELGSALSAVRDHSPRLVKGGAAC